MARIRLSHNDIGNVDVKCERVNVSGSKTSNKAPYINGGLVDVQTITYNMPKITLQNVHFTDESGTLSIEDVSTMFLLQNDTDKLVLTVEYGDGTDLELLGVTDINVVMESFSIPIDAKSTKDGYLPIGNLTFVQTK